MQVCVLTAAGGLPRALSFAAFLALSLPQAHGIGLPQRQRSRADGSAILNAFQHRGRKQTYTLANRSELRLCDPTSKVVSGGNTVGYGASLYHSGPHTLKSIM
jgi:hypothetical protein